MSGNGYAEAGTMAVEELRVQVATLLTEEQRDKDEVKRLVGGLEGLCESLRYSQMGMFKVFAYVSKKRVLGIDEPAPSAPVSAVPAAATDQPRHSSRHPRRGGLHGGRPRRGRCRRSLRARPACRRADGVRLTVHPVRACRRRACGRGSCGSRPPADTATGGRRSFRVRPARRSRACGRGSCRFPPCLPTRRRWPPPPPTTWSCCPPPTSAS